MANKTTDLDELSVAELREQAKDAGVTSTSHMRKDELIEALSSGKGARDEKAAKRTPRTRTNGDAASDDAIDILIADHRRVKSLFEEALDKEDGDAALADLAKQIIAELELHTRVEETIFYPALKEQAVSDDDDDAKDEVLEAYVEHGSVKELIAKIQKLEPDDESYKAILQVMSEQVEHHVEEEEHEMFDQAHELLGDERLAELGRRIAEAKAGAKPAA
jgi:hypothetical protein